MPLSYLSEARISSSKMGSHLCITDFPKGNSSSEKEKPGHASRLLYSSTLVLEKGLPPLFLSWFLGLLLGGLFRLRLLGLLFWRGLPFRSLFGRFCFRRGCRCRSFLLRFLAYDHEIFFLDFGDLMRFTAHLVFLFQPRQLTVIFEIVFLEIHSILPWRNLCAPMQTRPAGCCLVGISERPPRLRAVVCYRTRWKLSSILRSLRRNSPRRRWQTEHGSSVVTWPFSS